MNKLWKLTLVAAACLLTVAVPLASPDWANEESSELPATPAFQHNLLAVQVDEGSSGMPVVRLDLDGVVEYESFVLNGPDRLVVDLPGVVSRLDRYNIDVESAGVVRIRAGQHQLDPTPITRVVFDLEAPLAYGIEQVGSTVIVAFGDGAISWEPPTEETEEPIAQAAALRVEPPAPTTTAEWLETTAIEEPARAVDEPAPVAEEIVAQSPPAMPEAFPEREEKPTRSVEPDVIDRLLTAPALAAPAEPSSPPPPASFEGKTISGDVTYYSGKRISLNLVDADLKQVFRLFHEISGLNFVLDPGVQGKVTIVLDQVPWDQALDLILKNNGLDKELEQNVLRIASTQQLAKEAASRKQLKDAAELEVDPITLVRALSYVKADDAQKMLLGRGSGGGGGGGGRGGLLSPRGTVLADERTNTLIVSDIPKKIPAVEELLDTLDTASPQVMIEARIVETSRNFSQTLGVAWGFTAVADASHGTATGLSFPHNASGRYGLNFLGEPFPTGTLELSFGNVVDSFTLDIALNALETEGEGRILSSPRVATQNNERAEIEQGVRIPIVNTTATEINVEFVSASLKLGVTPQITAEGTVILDVLVENNSPDFINTAADIPSIRTQRAQTKVLVSDGGTTVIGGIFTVNDGKAETGVPWFRKIPVFGWLFRTQEITKENRELLIFITPKIVKIG